MKECCESVMKEIDARFNDKSLSKNWDYVDLRPFDQCQVHKTKKS